MATNACPLSQRRVRWPGPLLVRRSSRRFRGAFTSLVCLTDRRRRDVLSRLRLSPASCGLSWLPRFVQRCGLPAQKRPRPAPKLQCVLQIRAHLPDVSELAPDLKQDAGQLSNKLHMHEGAHECAPYEMRYSPNTDCGAAAANFSNAAPSSR